MEGSSGLSYRQITECRACHTPLPSPFLSLGTMPPANNLPKDRDQPEDRYPLDLTACRSCSLVQLGHVVSPEVLFSHYLYSSTSGMLGEHFDVMAVSLRDALGLGAESLVVDIGSNDGLLLSRFRSAGIGRIRGVEPAANLVAMARESKVPTIHGFFSNDSVEAILDEDDQADLITATNVFAHVDDIEGLTENVKCLLNPGGALVIEVPYLPVMLRSGTFDLVYHEHLSYFSVTPLVQFFEALGMEVFRVDDVASHGGSIRVFVQHKDGGHALDASVAAHLNDERGFGDTSVYSDFGKRVSRVVGDFAAELNDLKGRGFRLAGYAAPAKASTLLGFAEIDHNVLDYIVDDNPLKQGHYVPGTGIPIVASSTLTERPPDYLVILAWNLADIIVKKLNEQGERGIKFITPFGQAVSQEPREVH
jgi:SAM-dependent methyltransferase